MTRASWVHAASFIALFLLTGTPVRGQTTAATTTEERWPAAEIVAGVSIPAPADVDRRHAGVAVSATAFMYYDRLAAVGEVSLNKDAKSALAGLQIGRTLIKTPSTRLRLFGQALGGPQWRDGRRRAVFQPGLGLDDELWRHIVVRLEYDYQVAHGGRLVVGIGVPLGRGDFSDDLTRGHARLPR